MIDRRDFLIAASCIGALGTAEALRPRRRVNLLGDRDLSAGLPRKFGAWSAQEGGDIVVPQTDGSLAARLYSKQIIRTYARGDDRPPVMLVIAYGASQSDELQLHRPESCYPAVGFAIRDRRFVTLPIGADATVPAVALRAISSERQEDILYWTRLGEYLPRTAGEQRRTRLATALQGYVGDGVLVRASMVRTDRPNFDALSDFLRDLVRATQPDIRRVLVGTARSAAVRA